MEKRLYRSSDEKVAGGVLGGFAEYFGGDPVVWRLGAILLALLTAVIPVAAVYVIAWFITPLRPKTEYTVVHEHGE